MPDAVTVPSARLAPALWGLALAAAVLLIAAAALWTYYGTAVFFDMLATGLAYCF